MSNFIFNTKCELFKLVHKKKYIVLFILTVVCAVFRSGIGRIVENVSHGTISMVSNTIIEILPMLTDVVAPLIIFMAVTDLFGTEAQDNTLKASLLKPINRYKLLMSKAAAVFAVCVVYFLGVYCVSFIAQIAFSSSTRYVLSSAIAYLIDLIPLAALIFMAVVINLLIQSPTLAMLLCIGVYAAFKYMNYYVSPWGQMIFTAYSRWHNLWLGTTLPAHVLINKAGILFGSLLILASLSCIIFSKKDY